MIRSLVRGRLEGTEALGLWRSLRDEAFARRAPVSRTVHGFDFAGPASMRSGVFERADLPFWEAALSEVEGVVDVGANYGFYTCLARSRGRSVVAVEPIPANLALLYRNLELNGWTDTEVWPVALGDAPGVTKIYGGGTGASLKGGWSGVATSYRRTISIVTLDRILAGTQAVKRLVKIDVEGHELAVLRGARATLTTEPRPTWLVEICLREHWPGGQNPNFRRTFEMFWDRGYRVHRADATASPVTPADVDAWVAGGEPPTHNFVFRADRE